VYTTTFYSFKGGVGRTMAMVNVAVHLAKLGRRVLLVDFDLEAPGLETFPALRPRVTTPGIVDYVSAYLATGKAPSAVDHTFEVERTWGDGGGLWVMPAGLQDGQYSQRFHRIDWEYLYRERGGYLLFEDLKLQWAEVLEPDYVLIDSRTGHTDTGGICTRQLPDAVTILFFPNEQNLRGLQTVVEEIRSEAAAPRKKKVELHFVTANVPDLDDEDRILDERMRRFQEVLGYRHLAGTIHHYDSLSLLNQVVFAAERPRSRLSQEYQQLMRELIRHNPEDRDGALEFLRGVARRQVRHGDIPGEPELERRLARVRESHPGDGEILRSLAEIRREQGLMDEAREFLDEAIEVSGPSVEALLSRAEINVLVQHNQEAVADAKAVLASDGVPFRSVLRAVRLLGRLEPECLAKLPGEERLASLNLDERLSISQEFFRSYASLPRVTDILEPLLASTGVDREDRDGARSDLSLSLIGQARFDEARQLLAANREEVAASDQIHEVFNYAIAEWGATRRPPPDLFARVVELGKKRPEDETGANFWQCLALCHYVLKTPVRAHRALAQAEKRLLRDRRASEFSAWRYLRVSPSEFLEDLDSMRAMIRGRRILPLFMRRRGRGTHAVRQRPRARKAAKGATGTPS
jgi:MinD-like ATPase involved in chromosome partitioning or flagellar assembly